MSTAEVVEADQAEAALLPKAVSAMATTKGCLQQLQMQKTTTMVMKKRTPMIY
jgi:hypothetical protein